MQGSQQYSSKAVTLKIGSWVNETLRVLADTFGRVLINMNDLFQGSAVNYMVFHKVYCWLHCYIEITR